MSFFQELQKGFRFQVCGMFGESLRFMNDDGGVTRFIRILGAGKTYSFAVDSDEALAAVPPVGTPCRAGGVVLRRGKTTNANPKITELMLPDRPNWKAPTEEEFLAGVKFAGVGILVQKRGGEYKGTAYHKIQVSGWGDTYEFRDIPEDQFEKLPEKGNVQVVGRLEPVLSQGRVDDQNVTASDMRFVVENVRILEAAVERPAKSEKPAA